MKEGGSKAGMDKVQHIASSFVCHHISNLLTISRELLAWNMPSLLTIMVSVGSLPFSKCACTEELARQVALFL